MVHVRHSVVSVVCCGPINCQRTEIILANYRFMLWVFLFIIFTSYRYIMCFPREVLNTEMIHIIHLMHTFQQLLRYSYEMQDKYSAHV